MRCNTAKNLLTRQLREPLAPVEVEDLEGHLVACSACRRERHELQRFDAALRASDVEETLPAVRVDTDAILRQGRGRSFGFPWIPVAAGSAVLGGVLLSVSPRSSLTPHRPSSGPAAEVGRMAGNAPRRTVTAESGRQGKPASPLPENSGQEWKRPGVKPAERKVGLSVAIAGHPTSKPVASGKRRDRPALPALRVQASPAKKPSPAATDFPKPGTPATDQEATGAPARLNEDAVLAVAFVPARPAIKVAGPVDPALLDEPKLKARLTVAEMNRPLSEVLPRIGARLGIRLAAGRTVADDKVSFFFKERPAGEILTLIARHLDFTWTRSRGKLELVQDQGSRRREQALLRNELAPIEAQLGLAARLMQRPGLQLRPRLEELDKRLAEPGLAPEERARLQAEKQITLDVMLSPAAVDASLAVFRSLSPAQIDALLAGTEIRYSTATGTLPEAIAEKVHASTAILETRYGPIPRLQADATVRITDVEDQDQVPPPRADRHLRLECRFSTVRGTRENPRYWGSRWSPTLPAAPSSSDNEGAGDDKDPDLAREVDLELPGPVRQPLAIFGGSPLLAAHLGAVWPAQATMADVGAAIHRATGMEVLADSFVSARLDPSLLRGKKPLIRILEKLGQELDYTWEKRGPALLLRNRRFYRDRSAEVPERVLKPFRQEVLREKTLTLDALANLAAGLSDAQVRSMWHYWGWYLENTGILPTEYFFPHRQHLRFWASLAPMQKAHLRGGEPLPAAEMTAVQRGLWMTALQSPPESANTPSDERRLPTPEEATAGGFRLKQSEVHQVLYLGTSQDGKRRPGSGISYEGPLTEENRKFLLRPRGDLEIAGPPLSVAGYTFEYFLGGKAQPVRTTRVRIAPLQPTAKKEGD